MGQLLDKPKTEKIHCYSGVSQNARYGAAAMQGWRMEMEDAHTVIESISDLPDHQFLAVYDGHGGSLTAEIAGEKMIGILQATSQFKEYIKNPSPKLMGEAMAQAYLDFDDYMKEHLANTTADKQDTSGCTAIAVVITPTHIIACNAGDSRCILGKDNGVVPLSFDHKPYNPEEKERIEKAGGYVQMQRVMGDLALSRSLGDFMYKDVQGLDPKLQKVTAWPDIEIVERDHEKDESLVLACDGVWDVCENEEVAQFCRDVFSDGEKDLQLVAEELLDTCLGKQSKDNISAICVAFEKAAKFGTGDGVTGRRQARIKLLQDEEKNGNRNTF